MELKFTILEQFSKDNISYSDNQRYYQVVNLNNKKFYLDLIRKKERTFYLIKNNFYYLEDILGIFSEISKINKIKFGETTLNDISPEISKYIFNLTENENKDISFSIKVIFKNKEAFKFEGYFIDKDKHKFLLLQREKEEIEKIIAIEKSRSLVKKELITLYNKYNIREICYYGDTISFTQLSSWDTSEGFSYETIDCYGDESYGFCNLSTLRELAQELKEHGIKEKKYNKCIYFYEEKVELNPLFISSINNIIKLFSEEEKKEYNQPYLLPIYNIIKLFDEDENNDKTIFKFSEVYGNMYRSIKKMIFEEMCRIEKEFYTLKKSGVNPENIKLILDNSYYWANNSYHFRDGKWKYKEIGTYQKIRKEFYYMLRQDMQDVLTNVLPSKYNYMLTYK